MNDENLIPVTKRSEKEAREMSRKGGINSGKARRQKKTFKELFEIALSLQNEETGEQNDIGITSAMIKKALSGDVKAFESIRDTIGQKPIEKQEISQVGIQKIFVNKKDKKEVNKIIDDILNENE
ncbi:MAG: hypothetical protein II598_02570 [Elusimicrobia bacterium]|nr:hypothetical protein [Elusimicrobiota bacterium]